MTSADDSRTDAKPLKNILMIDRNYMIDRRIVLEAKLLRECGHRVALCASYGPSGANERNISGLTVLRFSETSIEQHDNRLRHNSFQNLSNESVLSRLQLELSDAEDALSQYRFNRAYQLSHRFLGRFLGGGLACLFGPRYAIKRIAGSSLPIAVSAPIVAALSILTFNFKVLSRLPSFLRRRDATGSTVEQYKRRIAYLQFEASCKEVEALPKPLTTLQKMQRMLRHPRFGIALLRDNPRKSRARCVLAFFLCLLTFDLYIYRNIGGFSSGRFPFFPEPPSEIEGLPEDIVDLCTNHPLEHWEKEVFHFAMGLDHIDVVHAHDLPSLRVGVLISQRRKIPLVYDAHELYSYQPGIRGDRKKRLFDLEHRLIKYCAEVVVINLEQAEVMKRDHGYDRFTALTNATEQPPGFDISQRYTYIHDALGLPQDAKTMLFMGGINRGRNIHLLLEGLAKAKHDVHMVFLTWGMEIPEFTNMAAELGIDKRVHFLDPVPWSEIVWWAASADVGVMPYQARDLNTRISSPNKMYEFIAAGTPMIGSSELVNVQKVVNAEGFGVLVPLHDASDYAKAIDEIFEPTLGGAERFRPALIRNAGKYLWDAESKAFRAMYTRLLGAETLIGTSQESP